MRIEKIFQFTPLHEGRRPVGRLAVGQAVISIHAPARGATVVPDEVYIKAGFQFTPLHEGRRQKRTISRGVIAGFLMYPSTISLSLRINHFFIKYNEQNITKPLRRSPGRICLVPIGAGHCILQQERFSRLHRRLSAHDIDLVLI